jgi:hypothetical protein
MAEIETADANSEEGFNAIFEAVKAGYDKQSLPLRLLLKWGIDIEEEVDTDQGFKYVLGDYLKLVRKEGKLAELLALAYSGNIGNPLLAAAARRYLEDPQAALAKYENAKPPELPGSLEALVTTRSKLVAFGEFLERVRSLGHRLCRIEVPGGGGTGFLVGASHVLTNHHVIQPVQEGRAPVEDVICRFDFWAPDGKGEAAGTPFHLAAEWLRGDSPYSRSDLTGTGEPGDSELDYALLRLDAEAGNGEAADGARRGWFDLPDKAPIIARGDAAMIPQHPAGRPLEVAYGRVLEFPGGGRRYRYDVTTEGGSSGSPVFDTDLTLFGLHHAADPAGAPDYNQAVPLWRVARDLQAHNVVWTG